MTLSSSQTPLESQIGSQYEKLVGGQLHQCLGKGGWVVDMWGSEERVFALAVQGLGPPVAGGSPYSRRGSSEEFWAPYKYRDRWHRLVGLPAF